MCFISKIKNLLNYCKDYNRDNSVDSDYYNGSENELENIFLELVKLSEDPINVFNRIAYSERIKFLANEGLHILSVNDLQPKPFKFTKEEIENIVNKKPVKKPTKKKVTKKQVKENIKKAVKNYKQNVKSSEYLF